MKKRIKKLWRAFEHQQLLTMKALKIIAQAYDQDSTEDGTPAATIKKPDIHAAIEPVKGDELMRHYR